MNLQRTSQGLRRDFAGTSHGVRRDLAGSPQGLCTEITGNKWQAGGLFKDREGCLKKRGAPSYALFWIFGLHLPDDPAVL